MSNSGQLWFSRESAGSSRPVPGDASLAAAAMRRVWLLETTQRVVSLIYQQDDIENCLPDVARIIYEQFGLVSVGIGVLEDGWIHYRGAASRATTTRARDFDHQGQAFPAPVPDTHSMDGHDGLDRSVKVPIRVGGEVYGVLSVAVNVDSRLTGEELETLEKIAAVLGAAIERSRRMHEQAERLQTFGKLQSILGRIQERPEPRSAGNDLLRDIETLFGVDRAQVGVVSGHDLHLYDAYRDAVALGAPAMIVPIRQGIIGRAARTGQPQIIQDVRQDPDFLRLDDLAGSLVCVPLWSHDEVIGVFRVATQTAEISPATIDAIGVLADRMGLVFANIRRLREIERRSTQLAVLNRLTSAIGRMVPTKAAMRDVIREIQSVWGPASSVALLIDGHLYFQGLEDAPGKPIIGEGVPIERGITGRVARTGVPEFVHEVKADPDFIDTGAGTWSEIAIPIKVDRRTVGILNVESPIERPLDEFDFETLMIVAENLGVAMANYDAFASEQDSRRALEAVQRVSTIVAQTLDPNEALRLIAETLAAVLRYPIVAVEVIDGDRLRLAASFGFPTGSLERQPLTGSLAGQVATTGEVEFIPNLTDRPDARPLRADALCAIYVPICTGNTLTGVLTIQGTADHMLTNWDVSLLQTFAESAGVLLANTRAYDEMRSSASVDSITGIANHRFFIQHLQQEMEAARRDERDLSLLVIDIDTFKEINDRFGHIEGDRVLAEIASRLTNQLREVDLLARYAGDEFVVVLPGVTMRASLEIAARLLRAVRSRPFELSDGDSIVVTLSIGAATFPADADTHEELIAAADTAMYLAKGYGRDAVCHYRDVSLLDSAESEDAPVVRLHQ